MRWLKIYAYALMMMGLPVEGMAQLQTKEETEKQLKKKGQTMKEDKKKQSKKALATVKEIVPVLEKPKVRGSADYHYQQALRKGDYPVSSPAAFNRVQVGLQSEVMGLPLRLDMLLSDEDNSYRQPMNRIRIMFDADQWLKNKKEAALAKQRALLEEVTELPVEDFKTIENFEQDPQVRAVMQQVDTAALARQISKWELPDTAKRRQQAEGVVAKQGLRLQDSLGQAGKAMAQLDSLKTGAGLRPGLLSDTSHMAGMTRSQKILFHQKLEEYNISPETYSRVACQRDSLRAKNEPLYRKYRLWKKWSETPTDSALTAVKSKPLRLTGLQVGTVFPDFGRHSIQGYPVNGGLIKGSKGTLEATFFGGKFERETPLPRSFDRYGTGLRVNQTLGERLQVAYQIVYTRDAGSGNPTAAVGVPIDTFRIVRPSHHTVVGTHIRYSIPALATQVFAECTYAMVRSLGLSEAAEANPADLAGVLGAELQQGVHRLKCAMLYVGPAYFSPGIAFLRNDLVGVEGAYHTRIKALKGLQSSTLVQVNADNLAGTKPETTTLTQVTQSLSFSHQSILVTQVSGSLAVASRKSGNQANQLLSGTVRLQYAINQVPVATHFIGSMHNQRFSTVPTDTQLRIQLVRMVELRQEVPLVSWMQTSISLQGRAANWNGVTDKTYTLAGNLAIGKGKRVTGSVQIGRNWSTLSGAYQHIQGQISAAITRQLNFELMWQIGQLQAAGPAQPIGNKEVTNQLNQPAFRQDVVQTKIRYAF